MQVLKVRACLTGIESIKIEELARLMQCISVMQCISMSVISIIKLETTFDKIIKLKF